MSDFKNRLDMKYLIFREKAKPWFFRIVCGLAVLGFLWGFFVPEHPSSLEKLGSGFVTALGVFIIMYMVGALINITLETALEYASESKNLFVQIFKFIFMVLCVLGVFDFALLGGTYIIEPIFAFLVEGSFDGTYWGCDNWRVIEDYEGVTRSFCEDDGY